MDLKYYKRYYCKDIENVENFEKAKADNFIGWCCHHRKGVDIPTEKLKALGQYYNVSADELIFLSTSEHRALHTEGEKNINYGKHFSEETRKRMSCSFDYEKHFTEETRKKMSEARKGKPKSDEHKKKLSESKKGEKNPMYGKHLSKETKKKMSEAHKGNTATKGMHWYNNGKMNKVCYECPEGFVPGMLR